MRVAVCFSGMPRSFKTVYESHKKFIFDVLLEQGIEYDIFIHTWNNKVKYPKYLSDEGTVEELIELYKPTAFKIETYDDEKIHELLNDSKVNEYHEYIDHNNDLNNIGDWIGGGLLTNNTISLFYGLNESNKLRIESSSSFLFPIFALLVFTASPNISFISKEGSSKIVVSSFDNLCTRV